MFAPIDKFLNKITMYRLVLYYLIGLVLIALVFGTFGILPYNPFELLFSLAVLLIVAWIANKVLADAFKAQPNFESVYITVLILALIITPVSPTSFSGMMFLVWAAVWAMASKYILAINKKHVFNPAAFAVALTALTIGGYASWWVGGNVPMMAFVVIGGLLVARKIQRFDLVISFFVAAMASVLLTSTTGDPVSLLGKAFTHAPLFFFAFIMLTEPLTTPPTRELRIAYGAMVGLLFAPAVHIGSIYSTPELALIAGNIFSYCVSPKGKHMFTLTEKREVGTDVVDFVFKVDRSIKFKPGQYMEWTIDLSPKAPFPLQSNSAGSAFVAPPQRIAGADASSSSLLGSPSGMGFRGGKSFWGKVFGQKNGDSRGNRRYFTIASSPTERDLHLGVKFYEPSSSFKKQLLKMEPGDRILGGNLAGDFVLPDDKNKKIAFIAGGIGVTPFRSMAKYLADSGESRSVVMLYSNRNVDDIAYREVFDEAKKKIGMKTVYVVTGADQTPPVGDGVKARLDAMLVKKEIPDYADRIFYVSGTHAMVTSLRGVFRELGIPQNHIKTDFFPGFA